jgi:hypothetical protein
MTKLMTCVLSTSILFAGAAAVADDAPKAQLTTNQKQMVRDCVADMQSKNNGSTHDQIKADCIAKVKNGPGKEGAMNDDAMKPSDK